MRRINQQFAAWVAKVKGDDSLRQAEMKTGLSYNTISRMEQGYPGVLESVVRFAEGYRQDVDTALELAGFEPLKRTSTPTGSELLIAGVAALQQELGRPLPVVFHGQIRATLTVEEAEALLADIRQRAIDGVI